MHCSGFGLVKKMKGNTWHQAIRVCMAMVYGYGEPALFSMASVLT